MIQTTVLPLSYRDRPWALRVEEVCLSWEATPYRLNGKEKGQAIDCLHFAACVLDELFGSDHGKDLKSLPPDACIHNKQGIAKATRALAESYPYDRVTDRTVEAGDLVVIGRRAPEHLMVASLRSRLWEANPGGVRWTGYGIPHDFLVVSVLRPHNKEAWV